uniref:C-type lectin domain-containing protein n=1 Tax=Labrus bergylta TaxID=56723 RepID=A0A3Q3G1U7_9LABR
MFNSQIFSLAYSPGFCTPILYARREFHYIDLKMNWADAQQYCREKYIDLATIESKVDNNRLKGIEPSEAWIGLHDDPLSWKGIGGNERNSWRWSSTGEFTERNNHYWRQSEPNSLYGQQNCVVMNSDTSLDEEDCGSRNKEEMYKCSFFPHSMLSAKTTRARPMFDMMNQSRLPRLPWLLREHRGEEGGCRWSTEGMLF